MARQDALTAVPITLFKRRGFIIRPFPKSRGAIGVSAIDSQYHSLCQPRYDEKLRVRLAAIAILQGDPASADRLVTDSAAPREARL
jgi:hypothetical protein